jgi:uncharacterized membrane protein
LAGRSCGKESVVAHHVAIAYPDLSRAKEVVAALKRLEAEGVVELKKAVAVIHDRERRLETMPVVVHALGGLLAGAAIGVVFGLLFSDILLGVLITAVIGTLCGIMIAFARNEEPNNYGFGAFGLQVAERLPDGSAAVLMLVHKRDPEKAIATLQQYGGTVVRTTLPTEIETRLLSAVNPVAAAA